MGEGSPGEVGEVDETSLGKVDHSGEVFWP